MRRGGRLANCCLYTRYGTPRDTAGRLLPHLLCHPRAPGNRGGAGAETKHAQTTGQVRQTAGSAATVVAPPAQPRRNKACRRPPPAPPAPSVPTSPECFLYMGAQSAAAGSGSVGTQQQGHTSERAGQEPRRRRKLGRRRKWLHGGRGQCWRDRGRWRRANGVEHSRVLSRWRATAGERQAGSGRACKASKSEAVAPRRRRQAAMLLHVSTSVRVPGAAGAREDGLTTACVAGLG